MIGFLIALVLTARAPVLAAPPSFQPAGEMTAARAGAAATLLQDGTVLVTGGDSLTAAADPISLASAELFDPKTNSFTALPPMTAVRHGYQTILLSDGRVLIIGGTVGNRTLNSVEVFDPATRAFALIGSLRQPRAFASATPLPDGRVLVAGGQNSGGEIRTAELFDPKTGQSQPTGNMAGPRSAHAAVALPDGRVVLAEGYGPTAQVRTVEIYDPATGLFSSHGSMITLGRVGGTLTLLANGKILMAGGDYLGNGGLIVNESLEIYDPDTGQSVITGETVTPRVGHVAITLTDGRVLLAGGSSASDSTELVDPVTGASSPGPAMNDARAVPAGVLLPDGRALVLGGVSDQGAVLDTAEVYVP
jgi:hypothetical protein